MWLCYPNNPTSATATREFFRAAIEFAERHDVILCHDAAYSEIYFDGERPISVLELDGAREVGIEFHSLSKTYNMTGWRIGFAVGNSELIAGLGKVKTNVDSGVFQAVQEAGIAALSGDQSCVAEARQIYQSRRDLVVKALGHAGFARYAREPRSTCGSRLPRVHVGGLRDQGARRDRRRHHAGHRLRTERGRLRPPEPHGERGPPGGGRRADREAQALAPMPAGVFIGLGSNLGDRRANIREALDRIRKQPDTRILKESSLYESEPHGDAKTWFVNGVIEIETELTPENLLKKLKGIESAMGRKRVKGKRWGSRIIDLDILFYGSLVLRKRTLKLPHPELANRRFVLLPLSELGPAAHPSGAAGDGVGSARLGEGRQESRAHAASRLSCRPWWISLKI